MFRRKSGVRNLKCVLVSLRHRTLKLKLVLEYHNSNSSSTLGFCKMICIKALLAVIWLVFNNHNLAKSHWLAL